MPLLPTNIVPLLRREAANERTHLAFTVGGIRDVFVPHPNRAVLIGDCGGVVVQHPTRLLAPNCAYPVKLSSGNAPRAETRIAAVPFTSIGA
jgi:hypothetical protein